AADDRLEVVIHNAGHMGFGPAEAFTPEQFAELYDVNVLSTQRVNRAALPQLRRQGQGRWMPLPAARITSPALGRTPTRHGLLNTTPAPMRVSRTRCSKGSSPSCRPMRMSLQSRTPSSRYSIPLWQATFPGTRLPDAGWRGGGQC